MGLRLLGASKGVKNEMDGFSGWSDGVQMRDESRHERVRSGSERGSSVVRSCACGCRRFVVEWCRYDIR